MIPEVAPVSRSVDRALRELVALRRELADRADCAAAEDRTAYERLLPRLANVERLVGCEEDPHALAELRALLFAAQRLREDMRRG